MLEMRVDRGPDSQDPPRNPQGSSYIISSRFWDGCPPSRVTDGLRPNGRRRFKLWCRRCPLSRARPCPSKRRSVRRPSESHASNANLHKPSKHGKMPNACTDTKEKAIRIAGDLEMAEQELSVPVRREWHTPIARVGPRASTLAQLLEPNTASRVNLDDIGVIGDENELDLTEDERTAYQTNKKKFAEDLVAAILRSWGSLRENRRGEARRSSGDAKAVDQETKGGDRGNRIKNRRDA